MLGEFIHQGNVYNIRTELDKPSQDEKPIKLQSIKEAQSFFAYAMLDPLTRKEILDVAKWLKPTTCRPPANCPKPSDQELINLLVLRVYEGDLRLFIYKPDTPIWFQDCCKQAIMDINHLLKGEKILDKALLASKLVLILFYPPGAPPIASLLSTAVNFTTTDWELLARAIASVPDVTRKSVYDIADLEAYNHLKDKKRNLQLYWEGVKDAYA
ncbi:MAG: hypothetical protein PVH87_08400 [Desulfobacteraceae bacterium]|jgi:hypothetical protein